MLKTTRRQFVGIVLGSAVLPTTNRVAGADNPTGAYGRANTDWLAKYAQSFRFLEKCDLDCSLGIVGLSDGQFLVARGRSQPGTGCSGSVVVTHADPEKRLVVTDESE